MIKDQLFKRIFIPLAGLAFPFVAGLLQVNKVPLQVIFLTQFFFILVAFLAWQGVVKLTAWLRTVVPLQQTIFIKLVSLPAAAGLFSAVLFYLASLLWQQVLFPQYSNNSMWQSLLVGSMGGMLLALLYEIAFLSVEKALDNRVLQQLDRERQRAEMTVLKNELDPHFFFNCMNSLSYLVRQDATKAYQFVHKLSNVYKYFLQTKAKDFVLLKDEMEFLENYYFLLQIRFDESIRIENNLEEQNEAVYILPCTLQVLVENAIKHNFFSEKEPLVVSILLNGQFMTVSNPVTPQQHAANSTKVGLRNLQARYRLLTNQNILVQKTNQKFLVKLPVVKQTNHHDKSSDY